MPKKKRKKSKIKKKPSRKKKVKNRKKRAVKRKNKTKKQSSKKIQKNKDNTSSQELIFKIKPEWIKSSLANKLQYQNKYKDSINLYESIKPGITGLWQVSGRNNLSYEQRVELDVYYVKNVSFLLDLYILFKTIPAVIFKRGAY